MWGPLSAPGLALQQVPWLWTHEDTENLCLELQAKGEQLSRPQCLERFDATIREHLRVMLCMSPAGPKLGERCRQYPSLTNCVRQIRLRAWPEPALQDVAVTLLGELGVHEAPIRLICVQGFQRSCEAPVGGRRHEGALLAAALLWLQPSAAGACLGRGLAAGGTRGGAWRAGWGGSHGGPQTPPWALVPGAPELRRWSGSSSVRATSSGST